MRMADVRAAARWGPGTAFQTAEEFSSVSEAANRIPGPSSGPTRWLCCRPKRSRLSAFGGCLDPESPLTVESREELVYLLGEAMRDRARPDV